MNNSVFKVTTIILLLVSGISGCRGPLENKVPALELNAKMSSLEFDAKEVPFSYSKSSLSVCKNRRSKCLALTDLRFALFGRNNEIFRFFYAEGSDILEPQSTATPGLLSLSTEEKVFAKACFESKKIFRLQGREFPLVLKFDAKLVQKEIVKVVSKGDNKFCIENKKPFGSSYHILSGHEGTIKYDKAKSQFSVYPSAKNSYEISVEESDSRWTSTGIKKSFKESAESAQQEYDAFSAKMPSLPKQYKESRELASYILWSCIMDKGGNYKRPGMLMSKNWMHYIWSWDHCFNAMACAYDLPEMAWDNYFTVFDAQDAEGRLPDVLGYARLDTSVLKAPIHGWTLNKMQQHMELTDSQLQDAYLTLKRWTSYWLNHRDSNKNGVPEYIQANDCWDNGSEFNINGDPNYIANRESATLSGYLITQMDQLHDLGLKLGKKDEAIEWEKKSDHLLTHLTEKLWDGNRFLTMNIADGSICAESRSLMRFLPIILGDKLPPEIVSKMKQDLTEGGYLTEWGLATESIKSPLYRDDGYWLGPIWAPTTLIIVDGFRRAGEEELAKDIAKKFCDMCAKNGFAENFNAKTGQALRDPAYTWTASVFLILGHEFLGEDYYIALDGADSNPGTLSKPFQSITHARNIVHQSTELKKKPITIYIKGDTYYIEDTLAFTAEDSGIPDATVAYAAYKGEEVVISGDTRLELNWQSCRDGILQAKTPEVLEIDQLFVNGKRQHMARYPNFNPKILPYNGFTADAFSAKRAARWADPTGGYIHAMHRAHWGGYHYRITGKNADNTVTYEGGWQNNRQMGMHKHKILCPGPPIRRLTIALAWLTIWVCVAQTAEVLVEAESFSERGGWVVDQQFIDIMGSPYLLARNEHRQPDRRGGGRSGILVRQIQDHSTPRGATTY